MTLESAPKPVLIPYTTSPLDIIFSTRFLESLIVEIEELDNITLVLKLDTEITCSIVKEFPSSTIKTGTQPLSFTRNSAGPSGSV